MTKAGFRKWKPKIGERFYYISQRGSISATRAGYSEDTIWKIATGNCYKTYNNCLLVLVKKMKELGIPYFDWGTPKFSKHAIKDKSMNKYLPRKNELL